MEDFSSKCDWLSYGHVALGSSFLLVNTGPAPAYRRLPGPRPRPSRMGVEGEGEPAQAQWSMSVEGGVEFYRIPQQEQSRRVKCEKRVNYTLGLSFSTHMRLLLHSLC